MRLIKARAQNYRSIEHSGEFEISDLTCLVGKNEAGKTALLNALRGFRPSDDFEFEKTKDDPRRFLNRYYERHRSRSSEVITTWWHLTKEEPPNCGACQYSRLPKTCGPLEGKS
ncbi:MAG: hypothetical protein C4535_09275 [Comamonadaceae bacterium]|nr:MAG: hypothetical protein C4535_09275 [Comamonadaceae bacterium]